MDQNFLDYLKYTRVWEIAMKKLSVVNEISYITNGDISRTNKWLKFHININRVLTQTVFYNAIICGNENFQTSGNQRERAWYVSDLKYTVHWWWLLENSYGSDDEWFYPIYLHLVTDVENS